MVDKRRNSDPRKPLLSNDEDDGFDLNHPVVKDEKTSFYLYLVIFIGSLGPCMLGVGVVWISPVAPKITSNDTSVNPLTYPVSTVELSFTGSLIQIGSILGAVFLKDTFHKFGPKRCLAKIHFLIVISFAALAFSKHIVLYFLFLFIIGLLIGGTNVGSPIYVSEVTQDHNRTNLSCLMGLFLQIGNLYGYIIGSYFSVEYFNLLCGVPSLLFFILSDIFLPESPTFLIMKKRKQEAVEAVRLLVRCDIEKAEKLADELEYEINLTAKLPSSSLKSILSNKTSRRAFTTTLVLMLLSCTGLPTIMSYLGTIFKESGFEFSNSLSTIIVGVFQVLCFFLASLILHRIGIRPLLVTSTLLSCIPLFVVGLYFDLQVLEPLAVVNVKWIPFAGIMVLIFLMDVGLVSVTYGYLNQVFTSDIKATCISIMYFSNGVYLSLSSFLFPILKDAIGLDWLFWIYAILFFAGFVYVFVKIPEIRGKNIIEIQQIFEDDKPPYINYK